MRSVLSQNKKCDTRLIRVLSIWMWRVTLEATTTHFNVLGPLTLNILTYGDLYPLPFPKINNDEISK